MADATRKPESLAERFWSIARARELTGDDPEIPDPVSVVNHVLAILDEVDMGHVGDDLSVNTVSFLHLLRVHEMGGDLSYASPEQIGGGELDERSLVFSIGVLIFERLTGRHPFGAAGNPQRVARISKVEFGSGVNYFPTVPSGLRTVLMKAMGPFREERLAQSQRAPRRPRVFCGSFAARRALARNRRQRTNPGLSTRGRPRRDRTGRPVAQRRHGSRAQAARAGPGSNPPPASDQE